MTGASVAWMAATSRRRMKSAVTITPTIISPAPTAKAIWKPSTSAEACWAAVGAAPPGRASVVVLAATVERIARPSAPPICCEELNSPDASPASLVPDVGGRDERERDEREAQAGRHHQ